MKPEKGTYNPYFQHYINLVPSENFMKELNLTHNITQQILSLISPEKEDYKYAEGKWSIKELVQHCIDCERVFQYRAMSFARNEKADLPGFDEDEYVIQSKTNKRTLKELSEEFQVVRNSTIALFKSFDESVLTNIGNANGGICSVLACGFIMCGHEIHHMNILQERYL